MFSYNCWWFSSPPNSCKGGEGKSRFRDNKGLEGHRFRDDHQNYPNNDKDPGGDLSDGGGIASLPAFFVGKSKSEYL